ncbi:hypothetical protein GN156_12555 [bacterium LRH843]|nr:hypothetical protein [bacterium LRH843]
MADRQLKLLKEKIIDYKRFGFVLFSLSIFLFIGLLIPTEGIASQMPGMVIGAIFISLTLAAVFHQLAMKAEKQLHNENEL